MEKLKELISKCKGSVSVDINDHKSVYEDVESYLYLSINPDNLEDIEKEVFDKMVENDTIIRIHFYPDTPIGFYCIFHYDLDLALQKALDTFNNKPNEN